MIILAQSIVKKAFEKPDENSFSEIQKMEDKTDLYEDVLNSYLINLSNKSLTQQDSKKVTAMFHNSSDIERIADYGMNIARTFFEKNTKGIDFSSQGNNEIEEIKETVFDTLILTVNILENKDATLLNNLDMLTEKIKHQKSNSRKNHVQRLKNKECSKSSGIYFVDLLTFMERIPAICSSIAHNAI
jgi:phosphate:Na+ symporter